MPPECQNAVVVQATIGHATGVSFGGSHVAEPYSRSRPEFRTHVCDVAGLWRQRLLQSRFVFLAGTDVVHQPIEEIAACLSAICRTFPIEPKSRGGTVRTTEDEGRPRFEGVHVFMENFEFPRPDRAGLRELGERGLVRMSVGVESGDPEVRSVYRKNWADDDLRAAIADLKSAGLGVSVLTIVGAGGVERADSHVEQTNRLISSLELGAGDFVFLLDENEVRDSNACPDDLTLLPRPEWLAQQAKLKEALAPLKKRSIKVLPYTLEKQWT